MIFKIVEINDWTEDGHKILMELGDACHMSEGDVMRYKLSEYEEKVENNKWPGLPFVCEAESEEEAIEKYNEANCEGDYYKATGADFEDRHDCSRIKLRQLLGYADDNTLFRIDKGDKGPDINVFNSDFSDDCEGVCQIVDPLLDREVSEFSVGISADPTNKPDEDRTMPTIWVRLMPEKSNDA